MVTGLHDASIRSVPFLNDQLTRASSSGVLPSWPPLFKLLGVKTKVTFVPTTTFLIDCFSVIQVLLDVDGCSLAFDVMNRLQARRRITNFFMAVDFCCRAT